MNHHSFSTEFARQLLAADAGLRSPEIREQREKLINRLAAAEQKERRARRFTLAATGLSLGAFAILYILAVQQVGRRVWPEAAQLALAAGIILFPILALLLGVIYFVNYRRELRRAENELHRLALAGLPRQISELRDELRKLRQTQGPPNPPPGPPAGGKTGFTLLELLMVVAILSLLAGLALPSFTHAKARARSLGCINNLGSIGKALSIYESEAGAYPGSGQAAAFTNQVPVLSKNSWDVRLLPYLSHASGALACPENAITDSTREHARSYGYNGFGGNHPGDSAQNLGLGLGGEHPLVKSGDVLAPSDMIAIGDLQLPPGVWWNIISPTRKKLGGLTGLVPARHQGGANMVFCDSHVEFGKKWAWTKTATLARRRWNNDNLPHPEGW